MRFKSLRFPILLLFLCAAGFSAARAAKAPEVRKESFDLLNQGVAAYNKGLYHDAVEKLRRAAAMSLNSFSVHYYLGLALIGDRQYEQAIEALSVALDLDAQHLQALVAWGDAYLKLGDVEEARAGYVRALKVRQEFAPAHDGMARSYESQADDERAVENYRKAIASNKGFAPAYTHLGNLYLRRGQLEEAVALLEEAISIRPDYAPGLNVLALAYGRLGLAHEAVATVQRAIELEPQSPDHWTTLGLLQLAQFSVVTAERSFQKALELEPKTWRARIGLAEVHQRRGEYDAALAEVALVADAPGIEAAGIELARSLGESLTRERAEIGRLERAVDAAAMPPEDLHALAVIYARRGQWQRAAEVQQRAASTPDERERLAYMQFQAGLYRQAGDIYADLAKESPGSVFHVNRGVSLASMGDETGAVAAYRRALEIDPTQSLASLYLGNALLRAGQRQDAALAYRQFLDRATGGEAAERVRRILKQIAPELLPARGASPPPPASPASVPKEAAE